MIARPPAPVLTRWSILVRDWLGSRTLRAMKAEAECLFERLCMDQWEHGCADSDKERWRASDGHRFYDFDKAWEQATRPFELTDAGLVHPRVAKDREDSMRNVAALSSMGSKAAHARWKATSDADRMRTVSDRIGSASAPDHSASASASESDPPIRPPLPSAGKPRRSVKIDPAKYPLPAAIDTPAVRSALVDYLATRKGGAWNEALAAVRVKQLAAWGPARAVAALANSVGYTGLFEPSGKPGGLFPPQQPPTGRTYQELQ